MRLHRAVVVVVIGALTMSCAIQDPSRPPAPGHPTFLTTDAAAPTAPAAPATPLPAATGSGQPWDPSPIDSAALLGSAETLSIPGDPPGAAAYLAAQVRQPATARAAVREVLMRSGIGIFRTDTGALAAVPADPSLVDAYLYEFQVPVLADAVARGASTSLAPVLDLLVALEWVPAETTAAQVEDLLTAWLDASAANPEGSASFAGLAVRELMKAGTASQAASGTTAEAIAGSPVRLDPLALELFLASVVSDPGHFGGQASAAPSAVLASVRISPPDAAPAPAEDYACNEPAKSYDSGLLDKTFKEAAKKIGGYIFGSSWTKAGSRVHDYGKILSTVQARAALLSGLSIGVTSDAGGTPHYRHTTGDGGGSSIWQFTATAGFNTPIAGRIINCGPLAGLRIPDNKGIEGLRLQWAISSNIECTERSQNCDSLGRIASGGGGDSTNFDGQSKLQVETIVEPGCPSQQNGFQTDKSRCKKGKTVNGTAWATVTPDLTTQPPLKLADLLFKPTSLPEDVAKALVKVLVDVATDIASAAKEAKGTQAVAYHEIQDYRVTSSSGEMKVNGTKCGGYVGPWTLKVSGNPDPSTKISGSINFTLDEDARGKATFDVRIVTTIKASGQTIRAELKLDGTADVELVNPDDAGSLQLTNVKTHGNAAGTDGNIMLKKAFSGDDGDAGIPVEHGTYCKS